MRFWRKSLLARLLAAFLGLALVSLAVVGVTSYQQGRRALERSIFNQLTAVATLKGDEITRWSGSLSQDVQLLARNPLVALHAEALGENVEPGAASLASYRVLKDYLDSVVAEKPDLLEIMVLRGSGGQVILSTNPAHEGLYEVTSSFFTEGRKATYVQNVYPSATLGKPAMTIATPLVNAQGETFAVLAVHLNLDQLEQVMKERSGLGETGETYLVDQYNSFISEARGGGESFPRGVHTTGIDTALQNRASGTGIYKNYRDVTVLGAYRWLEDREMALLAEIELREALAPARALARPVLAIGLVVTLLVVVFAYTLARQISQPIRALTETSTRMASGNLDLAVEIRTEDEIGTLARAFNSMAAQLRATVQGLEQRVAERTSQLERRAVQLATAAEVGRAATSILEPQRLAQQTVELLQDRFGLYYAGLFLVDEAGQQAILEAGTGEAGRTMRERGHKLQVGGLSMVGRACAERQARIALDVGAEPIRFDNPLLPDTRSELAVPLLVGERVLGALDVQSTQMAAFSEEEIAVLQMAANQVAVAIDNAHKFSSEAALLEAASPLFRVSQRLSRAMAVDQVVQGVIESISETEAEGCLMGRFGFGQDGEIETITFLGTWQRPGGAQASAYHPAPLHVPFPVAAAQVPLPLVDHAWHTEDMTADPRFPEESRAALSGLGMRAMSNIPLLTGDQVVGFVLVGRTVPGPFSRVALRLYETLANQASVAMERSRLLEEAQQRALRESAIRDVSGRVFSSFDLHTMLQNTLSELGALVGASGGYAELGIESQDEYELHSDGEDTLPGAGIAQAASPRSAHLRKRSQR